MFSAILTRSKFIPFHNFLCKFFYLYVYECMSFHTVLSSVCTHEAITTVKTLIYVAVTKDTFIPTCLYLHCYPKHQPTSVELSMDGTDLFSYSCFAIVVSRR